jgi:hypothetical protein
VKSSLRDSAPIVPIAAALIVGAAYGGACPSPETAGIAAGVASTVAILARRRPRLATVLIAAAALAAGTAAQGLALRNLGRRLAATFGDSTSLELDLVASVVAAPERDLEGGRSLAVVTDPTGTLPGLRLRLDVVDVPADDSLRFDGLRDGDTVRLWCRLRAPVAGPGTTEAVARRRLAAQRLDATGRVKSSRLVTVVSRGHVSPSRALDAARVAARGARYRRNHETLLVGMRELGFRVFLPSSVQSYIITVFNTPTDSKFSFEAFYHKLSDRGFIIYPGKLTQVDTFRIGNIGRLFPSDLDQLVHAIRGTLAEMGCAVPVTYR